MKHKSTKAVYAYWNEKRGQRPAPERADIDPTVIRHALGDTITLSADFVDRLRFRLAGTSVCALFGRELKGETINETVGAVVGSTGRTADRDEVALELLLLPLARGGHARTRVLGVLPPLVPPYWLGEKRVIELELDTVRHVGADFEHAGSARCPRGRPIAPRIRGLSWRPREPVWRRTG